MKAITLTQPWATLMAVGAKTVETRSWSSGFRGLLAIHAAKGLGPVGGMAGLVALCEQEPFKTALAPFISGYTPEERAADLPLGGVVAVAELDYVAPTGQKLEEHLRRRGYDVPFLLNEQERAFGNYAPGRFAWVFGRTLNIHDPIECKGALGLWTLPDEVRGQLAEITDVPE